MIQVGHKKKTGAEGLSFYHPSPLCLPDQVLAMMELSQYFVLSSKTVKPIIPRGARCVEHVEINEVCNLFTSATLAIRYHYTIMIKIILVFAMVVVFAMYGSSQRSGLTKKTDERFWNKYDGKDMFSVPRR